MDIRQLEYVIGVADHGGFSRAASALHVAQPSLSHGIRGVEAELGVELFHRVSRGVVLSSAGETFVMAGRQVLRDLNTLRASIEAIKGGEGGTLDLVCLPSLAVSPLVSLLAGFRKLRPLVSVRLVEPEAASEVFDMVHDGRCELGLTEIRATIPRGLNTDWLQDQEMLAVLPPGSPMPGSGRLTMQELEGWPIVATPPGTSSRDLIDCAFDAAGVNPSIAIESNQREAIVPLVLAGVGTSFLPSNLAERARDLGAMVLPLDPPLTRTIGIVRRIGPLSPAAQLFMEVVADSTWT